MGLGTVGNECYHPLDLIWDELEIGLQTCLRGITQVGNYLIVLTKAGRPATVTGSSPLAGLLHCLSRAKELRSSAHPPLLPDGA